VEVPRLIKMLKLKDRPALDAEMNRSGTTLKDVQRQFVEKTIASEWLRQKAPKPRPVTPEEMLEYYQQHIDEYKYEAQVKWEELMVRFDRFGGDRDAAWSALAKIGNEAWTSLRTNPAARGPAFAEIAKNKSHGFTAKDGGMHDWMTLGALKSAALNNALANMPLGQMSEGLESDVGFHIVRVLDRKAAGVVPFTEAQTKIKEKLEVEQKMRLLEAELEKLRKSAKVWTIFDGDLGGDRLAEVLKSTQRR
jgi:peptidyl-prolyl cis-trans isomerase SurA